MESHSLIMMSKLESAKALSDVNQDDNSNIMTLSITVITKLAKLFL